MRVGMARRVSSGRGIRHQRPGPGGSRRTPRAPDDTAAVTEASSWRGREPGRPRDKRPPRGRTPRPLLTMISDSTRARHRARCPRPSHPSPRTTTHGHPGPDRRESHEQPQVHRTEVPARQGQDAIQRPQARPPRREVVLPGEDPAEFAAELEGWAADWNPQSHTRAVLVERRRRVVAAAPERPRRGGPAPRLAEAAAQRFETEQREAIEGAVSLFQTDPRGGPARLGAHAAGADHLIGCWGGIASVLARGPAAWDSAHYHASLMALLGHLPDADPGQAGPAALASVRLLLSTGPDPEPLAEADARRAVAVILRASEAELRRLRAVRAGSRTPRPSASGRSARRASTRRRRPCSCTATRWPTSGRCGRRSRS